MSEEIKVNKLAKIFGTKITVSGFKMLRSGYTGLVPVLLPPGAIDTAIKKVANIPAVIYDFNYYSTSQENWDEMLDIISNIIVEFPWKEDVFDCDNRAKLVSSLISLFFNGINTCGELYCETTHINTGKKSKHYANLIITDNKDLYLYDVDNKRRRLLLEPGKPITMGYKTYRLISASFG